MDSELLLYWVFPGLPFSIVAYAFTLFLDNLWRNMHSCSIRHSRLGSEYALNKYNKLHKFYSASVRFVLGNISRRSC